MPSSSPALLRNDSICTFLRFLVGFLLKKSENTEIFSYHYIFLGNNRSKDTLFLGECLILPHTHLDTLVIIRVHLCPVCLSYLTHVLTELTEIIVDATLFLCFPWFLCGLFLYGLLRLTGLFIRSHQKIR